MKVNHITLTDGTVLASEATDNSTDELVEFVRSALANSAAMSIKLANGSTAVVPVNRILYVEVADED